jgi:arylsulfatase A-like enzyme/Flp pilus assembly protein TadD
MARKRPHKKAAPKEIPAAECPPRSPKTWRWGWAAIVAAVLAVLLLLVVGRGSQPEVETRPKTAADGITTGATTNELSLLVVTLDTTRADRIGAYGYPNIETPHLDRLAREGVVFEQAESVAPLTLPAHSSIFTGLFPPSHGVRDNGGFYLDEKHVVLAELLRDAGLRTGGFVGSFVLDSKWGIAQGFETYFDDFDLRKTTGRSLNEIERPAGEVADAALAWLDAAPRARFFSWVHFYDPHSPYAPPEPWASRYPNRPYVGEIAYTDSQVGRLLNWLDENDRADDTIVIVMGDHGESLGEHGESGHGFFVYEGATRVPFIIRAPFESMSNRRVITPVRSVDVLPTALELLGIEPTRPSDGASLVPLLTGDAQSMQLACYSEAFYPRYHFGWSELTALRVGDLKYIEAPRPELYDVAVDPREVRNLYRERSDVAERMSAQLRELESSWNVSAPTQRMEEIDPDTRARLAALGYLGNFVELDDESDERSELADPKDKIHLYNMMARAREASMHDNDSEAAIEALEQVVAEDPTVIDAWVTLGTEQRRIGRIDESIRSYKKSLELRPDSELAIINLAHSYRAAGADEEAILGFQQFLNLDPRNEQIHYELAQMLIDHNRLNEAERHLEEAIGLAPQMAAAQNARGVIALHRRDPGGAEILINEALAIKPDVRLAHFNLALIAEGRGDPRKAEELYRKELELYPASYKVEFNLGRLLGAIGDRTGQIGAFERCLEINPEFAEGHFFLAKAFLDSNENLNKAIELAQKGLSLGPTPAMAPMGHYLLADIYTRMGHAGEAAQEVARARSLEQAN